jgi:hypothetical protein
LKNGRRAAQNNTSEELLELGAGSPYTYADTGAVRCAQRCSMQGFRDRRVCMAGGAG